MKWTMSSSLVTGRRSGAEVWQCGELQICHPRKHMQGLAENVHCVAPSYKLSRFPQIVIVTHCHTSTPCKVSFICCPIPKRRTRPDLGRSGCPNDLACMANREHRDLIEEERMRRSRGNSQSERDRRRTERDAELRRRRYRQMTAV